MNRPRKAAAFYKKGFWMNKLLLRTLVEIKWSDSKAGEPIWEYYDELEPLMPALCNSVGYLLDDNKDYKTLAQTISNNQVLGRITIPVCSIETIVDIRKGTFLFSKEKQP